MNDSLTDDSFISPEKKTADLPSRGRKDGADETQDKENLRTRDTMNVTPPSSPKHTSSKCHKVISQFDQRKVAERITKLID